MAVHTSLNSLFTDIADKLREKGVEPDGIVFNEIECILPSANSACYGNGTFVVVGNNGYGINIANHRGTVMYSTDNCNSWGKFTFDCKEFTSVCYGNGMFVAIGSESGVFAYSEDGVYWTTAEEPFDLGTKICFGGGKFVTLNGSYSEDGINWTQNELFPSNYWKSMCYGDGKFVVRGGQSTIFHPFVMGGDTALYSEDGVHWNEVALPSARVCLCVSYGNGRFVADDNSYSDDGINWIDISEPADVGLVGFCNGKFIAYGRISSTKVGYFYLSEDGISWGVPLSPIVDDIVAPERMVQIVYGGGVYLTWPKNNSDHVMYIGSDKFIADNFPTMIEEMNGMNIAYGDTPPDDTSKLWIPLATKPDNVEISMDSLESSVDSIATKTAVLPAATSGSASVEINGKIYIFGGQISSTRTQILAYDPKTDTITPFKRTVVADDGSTTEEDVVMPANSYYAAAVAINGKAYIFGGTSYATNIYEFDPIAGTVTKKSALADGVQYASAVAINGKAYIFGGQTNSTNYTDMIQEYDPVTDTCVDTGINLAAKTYGTAAVAINGKAYIFGGYNYSDIIQEYDPSTNKIKTKEVVLLDGMLYASAVAINGKAYIFGGQTGSSLREDMIQEYDPITDTITEKTSVLASVLAQATASVANGKAYIFGGTSGSNTDTIQEYTVKSYLAENNVKLMATAVASGGEQIVTSIVNSKTGRVKMHILSAFVGDADGYAAEQTAYVYNTTTGAWQDLAGIPCEA